MKKKRLIIDMDDVMADATGQMIAFYEREFGLKIDRQSLAHKEEGKGFPAHHHNMVKEYPYRPDFFRTMNIMEGCQEVVEALNQKYDLFVVSAAMEFPQSLREKLDWLHQHFPFLQWRQFVFCGSKAVVHGDYMIDDLPYNLETFNGEKFLFSAPHNLQFNHYTRFNHWNEVGTHFL